MRDVLKVHKAISSPIEDLTTYRALPNDSIGMEQLNPFIFLNHHGPQKYPPANNGLPFGPHPHRGMETVTFILKGDITHKDSSGHESVITSGGVQWMTAGRGLIHSEVSSREFKKEGGEMEILQLWLNLPSEYKMTKPYYKGVQREEIPEVSLDNGKVTLQVISGTWEEAEGAFKSIANIDICTVYMKKEGEFKVRIPAEDNIFFYVVKGNVDVNGTEASVLNLVEFDHNDDELLIKADEESIIILGHAKPLKEKIVAYGPFVMNSEQEIMQAYKDYNEGKFGTWKE